MTSVNDDGDSESRYLLMSSRPGQQQTENGSTKAAHDTHRHSSVLNFNNKEVTMLRKERGWRWRRQPKPGSPEFPTARARFILYLVMFVHTFSGTSGTIDTQYYHSVYNAQYYNGTVKKATVSKCITNSSDPHKKVNEALTRSLSRFQEINTYMSLGPMFVAVIFFGSMSDVIGRRFLIIMPMVTSVCTHFVMLLIIYFNLDLHLCFVNSIVGGATGSGFVLMIGMYAYIADLTPPNQTRTFAMAIISFADSISSIAGQLIIGYMLQHMTFLSASLLPFTFKIITVCIAWWYLPETLPQRVRGIRPGCVNPIRYVVNVFSLFVSVGSRSKRVLMCVCMLILFLEYVFTKKHGSIFTLYELAEPFCWNPEQLSYYSSASAAFTSTMSLVSLRFLQKFFSGPVIMLLGHLSLVGRYVMEGLAYNTTMLYLAFVIGMIVSCASHVNKSLLSNMAGPEKQGAVFAAIAMADTISDFASNALYSNVYQATVATMRGAVFLIMGASATSFIALDLVFIRLSKSSEVKGLNTVSSKSPTATDESTV